MDAKTFSQNDQFRKKVSLWGTILLMQIISQHRKIESRHIADPAATGGAADAHCSEGGNLVILPEVGHESDGVLTKSQLSKYQRQTYFDPASLAIDILDDINHRNYVLTNLFWWLRSDIFSLKSRVFGAIPQAIFQPLWLVNIENLRNFLGSPLVQTRQMT